MTIKTKISYLFLGIVFCLGLFLRVYRLNLNIPPLYADETGQYQVLNKILYGSNPIEYLINTSFTFAWIFGLNPFGVRIASAIYGALLVLFIYFFSINLSNKNIFASLASSLLVAILPWSYMLSRIGHTHIQIVLLLVCLHVGLYLRAKKIKDVLICLIPLALAAVYYPSVIFVIPFVLILIILEIYNQLNPKTRPYFLLLFFFVILSIGTFVSIRSRIFSNGGRGLQLVVWNDVNTTYNSDRYRGLSWNSSPTIFSFNLPPENFANKLVYNRLTANLSVFAHNYMSFFSTDWLFLKGDPILRHSTGQVGTFFAVLLPFMIYGAYVFFQTESKKSKQVFLIWILASPLSAGITNDGAGYLLRVVTMLPFLTYFCALGLVESYKLFKKPWQFINGLFVFAMLIYSAYYFFYGYFHVYPSLSERSYEYGFKELSEFQLLNNNASILVIWDGYYHNNDFRFWQNTPYAQYQSFKTKEIVVGQTHFNQTFYNLYFSNPKSTEDVLEFIQKNDIDYIVLPDKYFINYPDSLEKKLGNPSQIINYPDKTPSLKIYINKFAKKTL